MKLLRYFLRAYPWQTLLMLLCLLIAALVEGIGVSTLLPVLSIALGDESSLDRSPYEDTVREAFARIGVEPTLAPLLLIVVAAFWTKSLLVLLSKTQVGYTVAHVATDLRLSLLRALLSARWSYYTRQPVGAAANAIATEANRASQAYHYLALILTYLIEALLYLGIALAVSWRAAAAALVAATFTVSVLNFLVRMAARAGRKQTRLMRSLLGRLTDALQAMKLLKATGREDAIGPLLSEDTRRLNRQLQRRVLSREALRSLQEPVMVSLMCLGLFAGRVLANMPVSEVLVLGLLVFRALTRINTIQQKYQSLMTEASALWSLVDRIEEAERNREPALGEREPQLREGVVLRDVRLDYEGRRILDGISLEIPAGRITAIVGPSGTGKTSLTDLLTGLALPEAGVVAVDGVPLEQLDTHRWRRRIGYVPQETLLLHDSIRNNVSFGDPAIDDQAIRAALRDAGAWEFVSQLPGDLDASVGERGTLLSGGQRQRVAIARALVHSPALLILDEATAALDSETETAVWATVEKLRGRTTVVAISHQPALASVADRVYRLEAGRAQLVSSERRDVA